MVTIFWQLVKYHTNKDGEPRYVIEFWRKVDRRDVISVVTKYIDEIEVRKQIELETGMRNYKLVNRNGK